MESKMRVFVFALFLIYSHTALAFTGGTIFKPTIQEIDKALFKLYVELKCPPKYHFKPKEYPYAYCISNLYYNIKSDLIIFDYNVYSDYMKTLKDTKLPAEKGNFRNLIEHIGFHLGVDIFGKTNSRIYGIIDIFNIDNTDTFGYPELSQWRSFIRERTIINLVYFDRQREWHQAANDLNKKYFYSKSKRQKKLNELIMR